MKFANLIILVFSFSLMIACSKSNGNPPALNDKPAGNNSPKQNFTNQSVKELCKTNAVLEITKGVILDRRDYSVSEYEGRKYLRFDSDNIDFETIAFVKTDTREIHFKGSLKGLEQSLYLEGANDKFNTFTFGEKNKSTKVSLPFKGKKNGYSADADTIIPPQYLAQYNNGRILQMSKKSNSNGFLSLKICKNLSATQSVWVNLVGPKEDREATVSEVNIYEVELSTSLKKEKDKDKKLRR